VLIGSLTSGRVPFDVSLEEVLGVVCLGIAGASIVEITLLDTTQPDVALAITQVASHGSAIPYRELGGPRSDTYQRHVLNRIDSTDTDPRWPEFCRGATAVGVHSVLSFPLVFAGDDLGTLCAYSNVEAGFSDHAQRVGAAFAPLTSAIVANAPAFRRSPG
jgi:GAF domain-containing protein